MLSESNTTSPTPLWYRSDQIDAFPTKAERIEHLQYLCIKVLLEIIEESLKNKESLKNNVVRLEEISQLMNQYNQLATSIELKPETTSYPIQTLQYENIIEVRENNTNSSEYSVLSLYEKHKNNIDNIFFKVKEKNSGVEPGFIGLQLKDVLVGIFKSFFANHDKNSLEDLQALFDDAKAKFTEKPINETYEQYDYYLVKNLYTNIIQVSAIGDFVVANQSDLKRTGAMKRADRISNIIGKAAVTSYQVGKTKSRIEKNKAALDEWLGNEIASHFMHAQSLDLLVGNCHGKLLFLLKGKWIKKTEALKAVDGVLVKNDALNDGKKYKSDDHITDLGEAFFPLISITDEDGIGSKAQKLKIK